MTRTKYLRPLTQSQRLELMKMKLKAVGIKPEDYTIRQKICMEMLRLIKEHPEYEDKIHAIEEREIFATSSREILFLVEVGRIKG